MTPFPWDDAARFAFRILKLTPDAFWRITPKELAMMAKAHTPQHLSMKRNDFQALMKEFPDIGDKK